MKIPVPKEIECYVNNINAVPLVEIKGTKWFLITEKEREILKDFLHNVDAVPEKVWKTWTDNEISENGMRGINADRIIRNCVLKCDNECGYRFVDTK